MQDTALSLTTIFMAKPGLFKIGFGIDKTFRLQDLRNPKYTRLYMDLNWMRREDDYLGHLYPLYPGLWSVDQTNGFINTGVHRHTVYGKGNKGVLDLDF